MALSEDLEFLEKFVLDADHRGDVLKTVRIFPLREQFRFTFLVAQLIPGSVQYFYFSILNEQLTHPHSASKEEEQLMKQAAKILGEESAYVKHFEMMRKLLNFDEAPQKTQDKFLEELRKDYFGVTYPYSRQEIATGEGHTTTNYPVTLDDRELKPEFLMQGVVDRQSLGELSEEGFYWFMKQGKFNKKQHGAIMNRLRPHHPNAVAFLLKAIGNDFSFSSFNYHRQLSLQQLEELARGDSDLLKDEAFLLDMLWAMQPGTDTDLEADRPAKAAYMAKLWDFAVETIPPSMNSLRATLLLSCLLFEREAGRYEEAHLVQFLKIPTRSSYVLDDYIEGFKRHPEQVAYINPRYGPMLSLPTIEAEELVHEYLIHLLPTRENLSPFNQYLGETYLRRVQAEAKVLAGAPDMEAFYPALGGPDAVRELKERVVLQFAPTNPTRFRAEDPVALQLWLKNVPTLVVNIFAVNTTTYYRTTKREIDATLDLDGLVASERLTLTYPEPPTLQRLVSFPLPALAGRRGVFVAEFIGGGKSSRAVIHKGSLRFVQRLSAAGHMFTIMDEANRVLPEATLWMDGREYHREGTEVPPRAHFRVPRSPAPLAPPIPCQCAKSAPTCRMSIPPSSPRPVAPQRNSARCPPFDSLRVILVGIHGGGDGVGMATGCWWRGARQTSIVVPYSSSGNPQQAIVLTHEGLSVLAHFAHQTERYTLHMGFYVDRESLVRFNRARVLVHASLLLNDAVPASLALIEEPLLTLTTNTTLTRACNVGMGCVTCADENEPSSKPFPNFALSDREDAVAEMRVPERIQQLTIGFRGAVRVISQGNRKEMLTATIQYAVNGIDTTAQFLSAHLCLDANRGYSVRVLGKSGEPIPGRPISLRARSRFVQAEREVMLQSDPQGLITLGHLEGIEMITCSDPGSGASYAWTLPDLSVTPRLLPNQQCCLAGQVIRIPFTGSAEAAARVTLHERNAAGSFSRTLSSSVKYERGFLVVPPLAGGDYVLKEPSTDLECVLLVMQQPEGPADDALRGYVASRVRIGELRNLDAVQLVEAREEAGRLVVQLAHPSPAARVHLFATHFVPRFSAHQQLCKVGPTEPKLTTFGATKALYESGRALGEEQRYILDRKLVAPRVGNMLPRPQLLLNPWATKSTATARQDAAAGDQFQQGARNTAAAEAAAGRRGLAQDQRVPGTVDLSNLDFLASASAVLLNGRPDPATGTLVMDAAQFVRPGQSCLTVVVVDGDHVLTRRVALRARPAPEGESLYRDLRLLRPFEPRSHLVERKAVALMAPAGTPATPPVEGGAGAQGPPETVAEFRLEDLSTSSWEAYDSVQKVYTLLLTLSGQSSPAAAATLREMDFLPRWQALTEAERAEKYSQYACHEVDFFLWRKDRAFFDRAVMPFLILSPTGLAPTAGPHRTRARPASAPPPWILTRSLAPPPRSATEPFATAIRMQHRANAVPQQAAIDYSTLLCPLPSSSSTVRLLTHWPEDRLFETALRSSAMDEPPANRKPMMAAQPAPPPPPPGAGGFGYGMAMPGYGMPMGMAFGGAAPPPPPPCPASAPRPMMAMMAMAPADPFAAMAAPSSSSSSSAFDAERELDARRRVAARPQLFEPLDKTKEYADQYYYNVLRATPGLVPASRFWADYATWLLGGASEAPRAPFLSAHLCHATGSFTEMAAALAVLDLPFAPAEHDFDFQTTGGSTSLRLAARSPAVLFHKEIVPCPDCEPGQPILVQQNFYDPADRTAQVGDETVNKYIHPVRGQFAPYKVYGIEMVVTNTSNSQLRLDVLTQIPMGAVPVSGGFYSKCRAMDVAGFSTTRLEWLFYFPRCGQFTFFPAHVSRRGLLMACVPPAEGPLQVVENPAARDTTSWRYVANMATDQQTSRRLTHVHVLEYLARENLARPGINLSEIAWRMNDKATFTQVVDLLRARHIYEDALWSFGFKHADPAAVAEWIGRHPLLDRVERQELVPVQTRLFRRDPIAAGTLRHLEYRPFVNARAHQLGEKREILNDSFKAQYHKFLFYAAHKAVPSLEDLLGPSFSHTPPTLAPARRASSPLTYYLLLQDRIEEATKLFGTLATRFAPAPEGPLRMQYDYLAAYLDFFAVTLDQPATAPAAAAPATAADAAAAAAAPSAAPVLRPSSLAVARATVDKYKQYPVARWRRMFEEIAAQLAEIDAAQRGAQSPASPAAMAEEVDRHMADTESERELRRARRQANTVQVEPSLEMAVESEERRLRVTFANLAKPVATVRYYLMDVEELFSAEPFVAQAGERFSYIQPNFEETIDLTQATPAGAHSTLMRLERPILDKVNNANAFIELTAEGLRRTALFYSNALQVQLFENFGQLKVTHRSTGKCLPKVYVKVYAKTTTGERFYKDGYTDLRGRFDYASLSTDDLTHTQRFAILVLSPEFGAVVREALPPKH
ncbi:putative Actin-binding protein F [Paratrimastix pyriformis]|uniref:Actin-binding protein F n=1 Tax=Paratrimastix pyriformis TaxID=342808 RepID=A0ABQ8UXR4_9EUKA|nr:putative Actin-binding protein F [Paratrimastix pyriformis]